ncbi:suppressor of cytokine signaling 2-like [Argonauta hians]
MSPTQCYSDSSQQLPQLFDRHRKNLVSSPKTRNLDCNKHEGTQPSTRRTTNARNNSQTTNARNNSQTTNARNNSQTPSARNNSQTPSARNNSQTTDANIVPSGYVQSCSRLAIPSTRTNLSSSNSFDDFQTLSYNEVCLHFGKWYFGAISNDEAKLLLKHCKYGTFLVRCSSNPKYLYSLSVNSQQGVTSVRIAYNKGIFYLDCDEKLQKQMPKFRSVMDLVQYYSNRRNKCLLNNGNRCVWVDSNNKRYNSSELTTPKLHSVPSLTHLSRLAINNYSAEYNQNLQVTNSQDWRDSLGLPKSLGDFLKQYPYVI